MEPESLKAMVFIDVTGCLDDRLSGRPGLMHCFPTSFLWDNLNLLKLSRDFNSVISV